MLRQSFKKSLRSQRNQFNRLKNLTSSPKQNIIRCKLSSKSLPPSSSWSRPWLMSVFVARVAGAENEPAIVVSNYWLYETRNQENRIMDGIYMRSVELSSRPEEGRMQHFRPSTSTSQPKLPSAAYYSRNKRPRPKQISQLPISPSRCFQQHSLIFDQVPPFAALDHWIGKGH